MGLKVGYAVRVRKPWRMDEPYINLKTSVSHNVIAGIELMHMVRKGQMIVAEGENLSFADQFYSLAA